nr:hypothetical protein [Candidatus Sigynarchaeota archaeon]
MAGNLFANLLKGSVIEWRDTFIVAIFIPHGKKINTCNPEHIIRVQDLDVVEST